MNIRKTNIDFIRIFAIFMTIVIHVSNIYIADFENLSNVDFFVSVTYNSLSRICVPLFFMVSGIFLIRQDFEPKKYTKRIFKFIAILVVWSVIYVVFNSDGKVKNLTSIIFHSLFTANKTSRHLWFLYAIIGIYIALPFIQSMCKNLTKTQENLFLFLWYAFSGLVVILVPLSRFFTNSNVDITYPIPIINSCYYLGYFISGHILYKRFKDLRPSNKKNLMLLIGYLTSTLFTILITYFISLKNNEFYGNMQWYRSIFTSLASAAIFILIVINKEKFASNVITKLSTLSFGVYLIHMIFLRLITEHFNILLLNPLLFIPIISVIVYLCSLVSSFILSKIPFIKNLVL